MRIAFLCKRRYTGKDVILDRFGRLFELPHQLMQMGHELDVHCLDYAGREDHRQHYMAAGSMRWASTAVGGMKAARAIVLPLRLRTALKSFKPDVVMGASDIPHVALAAWLGRQLHIPSVIDLYDNFESFGQARIPGFRASLRYAIRNASLVTTVSHALEEKIRLEHAGHVDTLVLNNGVRKASFAPMPRAQARAELGLPATATLVGTAGGLSRMKGVDVIYAAWPALAESHPDLHLVLAGPVERTLPIPSGARVHYLGELAEDRVATLFSALDMGIVSLADSAFGRYCFPQKASEMIACGLPVVVADVGEMRTLFSAWQRVLYPAGDPHGLAAAVLAQLSGPVLPSVPVSDWSELAGRLESELKRLLSV